jgi:hypothetical protein
MMLLVLTLIADRHPAGQIAGRLFDSFPTRFTNSEDALAFVGDVLAQYS